ncbi:uncharacterized protein GGS25DRAFT_529153 [Hypoxylon fragiforme]|uniref:uncharacterized protein n=1 Tax=Hypoxylon fragiforme TaxID=63214 RepID=UPI0020C73BCC|nr:uncharacterized protein GGS25DRAFT_529153 [Hypoxylon fragiforme]KAI2612439.1 hypothetical protein GGS25DRAFT_529153 [Hypoxylon fragiforme]
MSKQIPLYVRAYGAACSIIHPATPYHISVAYLNRLTFILLVFTTLTSLALVSATAAISRRSNNNNTNNNATITALTIAYLTVVPLIAILVLFLYTRIIFFKRHPARSPSIRYAEPHTEYHEDHYEYGSREEQEEEEGTAEGFTEAPSPQVGMAGLRNTGFEDFEARPSQTFPSGYPVPSPADSYRRRAYRAAAAAVYEEEEEEDDGEDGVAALEMYGPLAKLAGGAMRGAYPQGPGAAQTFPFSSEDLELADEGVYDSRGGARFGRGVPSRYEVRRYPEYTENTVARQGSMKGVVQSPTSAFGPSLERMPDGAWGLPRRDEIHQDPRNK